MDVKNKQVTVVGMGKTSMPLVRLLSREGAIPFVTDASNATSLQPYREELETLGITYECGGHTAEAFEHCALVIPSPGVDPGIKPIQDAVRNGAALLSEMEFAFTRCTSKIVAVTGTNGKTTTTELIRSMIEACGHTVSLAGNNAFPFSAAILEPAQPEYIVLEVSSYQLELTQTFHPWIGILLNITEDHLARHGTMKAYTDTKARLFKCQAADEFAILNQDNELCRGIGNGLPGRLWGFSREHQVDPGLWLDGDAVRQGGEQIASRCDTPLPGAHNEQNVLAALCAMRAGDFDWQSSLKGLRVFTGVEHRLEPVGHIGGVAFVNDSKSTNLESLRVALESFDTPVILIAGGKGKGGDYIQLRDLVKSSVATLITIGEDASLLEDAFAASVETIRATDMNDAVTQAFERAGGDGTVLLSPGCASFDMFNDFEERGRAFKECVDTLQAHEANKKGATH